MRTGRYNQVRAPIYEALEEFRRNRIVPFDVPGHKRGRGNPELVELLEEDKELQGDLRYLLGAGRIRTCYSVYGKAVDQNEIEESRLFTDIENWEASSRKQSDEEGDTILDFLHNSGIESRQLLGALARNSLIILYVDMMSGEYKVYYRGNQRLMD